MKLAPKQKMVAVGNWTVDLLKPPNDANESNDTHLYICQPRRFLRQRRPSWSHVSHSNLQRSNDNNLTAAQNGQGPTLLQT